MQPPALERSAARTRCDRSIPRDNYEPKVLVDL